MSPTERAVRMFREKAILHGFEFLCLREDGHLFLSNVAPAAPGCVAYAPALSDEADELISCAVEDLGFARIY